MDGRQVMIARVTQMESRFDERSNADVSMRVLANGKAIADKIKLLVETIPSEQVLDAVIVVVAAMAKDNR
jgi:hypothetical protein